MTTNKKSGMLLFEINMFRRHFAIVISYGFKTKTVTLHIDSNITTVP